MMLRRNVFDPHMKEGHKFILQALQEAFGISGPAGPESLVAIERTADLLTAKAGAKDPSAIPSICRINAATQNISGIVVT